MLATGSFYLPKNDSEALVICHAYRYQGFIQVHSEVAVHEGSNFYKRTATATSWGSQLRVMETKGLDKSGKQDHELDILDGILKASGTDFAKVTGPFLEGLTAKNEKKTWQYDHDNFLSLLKWEAYQKRAAEKLELRLLEKGKLYVVENPAFTWLREKYSYADDVFLKTLFLLEECGRGISSLAPLESELREARERNKQVEEEKQAEAQKFIERVRQIAQSLPPGNPISVLDRNGNVQQVDRHYVAGQIARGVYRLP